MEDVSDTFDEENIENSMVNAIIVKNGYGVAKSAGVQLWKSIILFNL